MKSGIYLIKNIQNNKVYVGSALNIDKRWKQHKNHLKRGKHHSCHLQSAWDKYGEQSFKLEIIQEVFIPEHLLAYEQVYLDYYKSYEIDKGYNICKVAGSPLGVKQSEETINNKSGKNHPFYGKKRLLSDEARKNISEANKRRIVSEETKKKMRNKRWSEEAKKKMSETRKGRIVSKETRKKMSEARRKSDNNKYYYFDKEFNKYRVVIWRNHIGYYNTEEEAKQAVIINLEKLKAQEIVSS